MNSSATTKGFGLPHSVVGLPLVALLAGTVTALAYWPGLMTWDAVRQYSQALSGQMDDWHPPIMEFIWRQAIPIYPGPAPMLVLQLALYWGGWTTIAVAFWQRGRRRVAWALLFCGLWPLGFALTGMVLKDCLMAGALLVATGLLAFGHDRGRLVKSLVAAVMLVFAATLRFNAFAACLPLMVALCPSAWWDRWPRLLIVSFAATTALMAAMPLANRMIGAQPSGVELSLIIFDLGGITQQSGISVFPAELGVRNPVVTNRSCYRPDKWDSYSDWVNPECPLGFTAWNGNIAPGDINPYAVWVRAIAEHPFAYAAHRLHHFAISTRILPDADLIDRPLPNTEAPNPWGFQITPNPLMRAIDDLAVAVAHTPLGWPITWIGAALGALIASWRLPGARLIAPLALSSVLYGCTYAVFGVASELRYYLWTELAALVAVVLVLADPEIRAHGWLARAVPTLAIAVAMGAICRFVAL